MQGELQPVNTRVAERNLKYYIFDWDDNILHMPTYIHLERRLSNGSWVPHLVSTALFSVIRNDTERYRPPGGDWEKAFFEFRDLPTDDESRFLKDARAALDRVREGTEKAPPSFQTFRRTLVEGRLFAIVTARGHHSDTLRRGVELFIERVLTPAEKQQMLSNLRGYLVCYKGEAANRSLDDAGVLDYYLGLNKYHAVTSPQFRELVEGVLPDPERPEARKQFAIRDFLDHLFEILETMPVRKPISVGFSDDDPANVRAVEEFIRDELAKRFPAVRFVVYDTSDPTIENGRKIVVSGQLDLGLDTPRTEASVRTDRP